MNAIKEVTKITGIHREDLFSGRRRIKILKPRQLLIYAYVRLLNYRPYQVERNFKRLGISGFDHANIWHTLRMMDAQYYRYAREIKELIQTMDHVKNSPHQRNQNGTRWSYNPIHSPGQRIAVAC